MTTQSIEVGRYRITLTTTEDEYRTVLTCNDCPYAPVAFRPDLVVRDPPIVTVAARRSWTSSIGIAAVVPAAFRHEFVTHAPPGVVCEQRDRDMAMLATPSGLRLMAEMLDGLAVLTKGEIGVRMADVAVTGGIGEEHEAAPGSAD